MGLDLLIWVMVAGYSAGPVNNLFTLGKNISSAMSFIAGKDDTQSAEYRFSKVAPVASLVQRHVLARALRLSATQIVTSGFIIYLTGKFTLSQFDLNEWVDIAVAVFVISVTYGVERIEKFKTLIASEEELAILREFEQCYQDFVREKHEEFKIPNNFERFVLDFLADDGAHAQKAASLRGKIQASGTSSKQGDNIAPETLAKTLVTLEKKGYAKRTGWGGGYYRVAKKYTKLHAHSKDQPGGAKGHEGKQHYLP